MASTVQFHNVVRIETRSINYPPTDITEHAFDNYKIVATDANDQIMTVDLFMKSGASASLPVISMTDATPTICTLDMTRKFAVNGLRDEMVGICGDDKDKIGFNAGILSEALVRYLESYGARFQDEVES